MEKNFDIQERQVPSDGYSSRATVVGTVLSAPCALVPVPFLDDILLAKVRKGMVHRVLRENGVLTDPRRMKVVYAGISKGCFLTVIGLAGSLVVKIFKKLFRTIFFIFAVRGAALEMTETYLLGRVVIRCAERGWYSDPDTCREQALHTRAAFNKAMNGTDGRVFVKAMKAVWRGAASSKSVVKRLAKHLVRGSKSSPEVGEEDLTSEDRRVVEEGEKSVNRQLRQKEVQEFLAKFDERFDRYLENELEESSKDEKSTSQIFQSENSVS
ncbi:MAG: hypothetical protein CMO55_26015 [Verrucomicrobiales bacterium]|nr:hypothetical protein [Verrucomicrobiales bacterium]